MSEDLTKKLPKSDSEKLSYVVTAVQDLTSRIQVLDNKVDALDNRFQVLDKRVEALDEKVEERLYDTRPIWEQVVANVAQLQEGQQRIEEGLELSRNESRETDSFARYSASNEHLQRHVGHDTSGLSRYLRSCSPLGTEKQLVISPTQNESSRPGKQDRSPKTKRPFFTRLLPPTPFPILQKQ